MANAENSPPIIDASEEEIIETLIAAGIVLIQLAEETKNKKSPRRGQHMTDAGTGKNRRIHI